MLGILDRIFPEYPDCFSDVFIRTSRELLKSYPEPEELAEVDLSELSAFLKEHSRGRFGEERAKKIQSLAKGTFGITMALDAFTLQLRLWLSKSNLLKNKIRVMRRCD